MGGYVYDPYSGTMQYDPFAAGDSGPTLPQTSSMPPMMAGAQSQPQVQPSQPAYKPEVPNVMTGLNKVVDGFFGSSRNQSGSFDPNRVEAIISKLPAEQQEEARLRFALAKEQADLFAKSRPNTSNFNLGNLFQGLGAVAYMTSKNPQVWSHSQAALNRIYQGNEDREKSARAYDMAGMKAYSDVLGDLGDSAAKQMAKRRQDRDDAMDRAATSLSIADSDPEMSDEEFEATRDALASSMEMRGFKVEANEIRKRKRSRSMGASPALNSMPQGSAAPAPVSGQQSRVVTPSPSDPAGVAPPPSPAESSVYVTPQEIRKLYRAGQNRIIQGDKEGGKAMIERAQIADRAAADAWRQSQSARHGKYGLNPQKLIDETDGFAGLAVVGNDGTSKFVEPPRPGLRFADPSIIAGQTAAEKEAGKMRGEARQNLNKVVQQAGENAFIVDQILNHPALNRSVGPIDQYRPDMTEGAQEFAGLFDQLQGDLFLGAFQSLRGGGQITEAEGRKATKARSALRLGMGEKDFRKHLEIIKRVTHNGVIRAKVDAGILPRSALSAVYDMEDEGAGGMGEGLNAPNRTSVRKRYNPNTGQLEEVR